MRVRPARSAVGTSKITKYVAVGRGSPARTRRPRACLGRLRPGGPDKAPHRSPGTGAGCRRRMGGRIRALGSPGGIRVPDDPRRIAVDDREGGHRMRHHGAGGNLGPRADRHAREDRGVRTDDHAVLEDRRGVPRVIRRGTTTFGPMSTFPSTRTPRGTVCARHQPQAAHCSTGIANVARPSKAEAQLLPVADPDDAAGAGRQLGRRQDRGEHEARQEPRRGVLSAADGAGRHRLAGDAAAAGIAGGVGGDRQGGADRRRGVLCVVRANGPAVVAATARRRPRRSNGPVPSRPPWWATMSARKNPMTAAPC